MPVDPWLSSLVLKTKQVHEAERRGLLDDPGNGYVQAKQTGRMRMYKLASGQLVRSFKPPIADAVYTTQYSVHH